MEIGIPEGVDRVVLVEGESDRNAVEALAQRRSIDLPRLGVAVVAMGGATNATHYVTACKRAGIQVGGLYDLAEAGDFRRALQRNGIAGELTLHDLSRLGFFVCIEDLEDELIRALGTDRVLEVIEEQGEGNKFHTLQHQPFHRDRDLVSQLRRFLGTHSGRKITYGRALVEALIDTPAPLASVLDWATT